MAFRSLGLRIFVPPPQTRRQVSAYGDGAPEKTLETQQKNSWSHTTIEILAMSLNKVSN